MKIRKVYFLNNILVLLCVVGTSISQQILERHSELIAGPSDLREAYFDGSGYIRLLSTISLRQQTGLSFKTCYGGELFSQTRNETTISLTVHAEGLRMVVSNSIKRTEITLPVSHESLLNNRWHTINIIYRFKNLTLSVDGYSEVIANETYNSELLTNSDLYKEDAILIIGKNYNGCILEGPSIVFVSELIKSHNVVFGPCPLPRDSCTVRQEMIGMTSSMLPSTPIDHCSNEPCMRHGICISHADRYECKCTARYTSKNCEVDLGPPCERPSPLGLPLCRNGATCTEDVTGNYTCHCLQGFTGQHCETEFKIHPLCEHSPCKNNGTCTVSSKGDKYQCVCQSGFAGPDCETNINECLSNPCQNGGNCIDMINNFTCICDGTGYEGRYCDININECLTHPCLHQGICFDNYGSYVCQCQNGFYGKNCEMNINECALNPCKNDAMCLDQIGGYECRCLSGFTGVHCEHQISSCTGIQCPSNAECIEADETYHCLCKSGFGVNEVSNCTDSLTCNHNPCLNHGTCVPSGNSFKCVCPAGYTGVQCERVQMCMPDTCLNGGSCIIEGYSYRCLCPKGFGGSNCAHSLTCADRPCLYATSCQDYIGGYYCECKAGWTGPDCDVPISKCASNPCRNGATCIDSDNAFFCKCLPGFMGKICQQDIDDCLSNPCKNGGLCNDLINGYNCTCSDMWMGHNCEKPYDACERLQPCKNNGTCITDSYNQHKYKCDCIKGFEGNHCEVNINDCVDISCPNHQICVDGINSYECRCPPGYGGESCATVLESCDLPGACINGTCVNNPNDTATCICHKGFQGKRCDEDVDECAGNMTICNYGICVNTFGSFDCYCRPGYTGNLCDQDFNECLSHPCKNEATCINKVNNFDCICPPGYTSKDCGIDIDECESNPCAEGSTCLNQIASFTCLCQPGLTGERCDIDIDDCEPGPCLNNGKCIDGLNSYTCDCNNTGFVGVHCEDNIDDCISSPCQNGAECIDGINDYVCGCYPGFTGKNCETDIDECANNPCKNSGTCLQKSNQTLYDERFQDSLNFTLPGSFQGKFNYNNSNGYICLCVPGITGQSCETNINECESNPCFNGQCIDHIGNYTCECDDGFEGLQCEHDIDECLKYKPCVHGTCIDRRANYFCDCAPGYGGKNCSVELTGCLDEGACLNNGTCKPYLENEIHHKFNCSCTNGFHGATCEKITTMSLNGSSYVIVNTTRDEGYDIQFRFKTTLAYGLLAIGKGLTFYILELVNGRLNLHSSLLNKWEGVFIGSGLNDSKWQKVFVAINSSHLVLAANEEQTIYPISQIEGFNESQTSFPTTYLGGTMNYLRQLTHGPSFFVGCTQDVVINGQWVLPQLSMPATQGDPVHLQNIEMGCPREPQCEPNPCHSGGHCKDLWRTFSCSCERPYLGHTCQYNYTAATFGHENTTNSLVTVSVTESARRAVRSIVHISMFIRTRQNKGQIFYLGSSITSVNFMEETYIAAQLEAGELLVKIRFNGTPEAYTVGGVKLDNGYNHLIEVSRNVTLVQVKLNGTEYFRKTISATGQLDVQTLYLGGLPQVSRPVRQAEVGTGSGSTSGTSSHRAELNTSEANFKGIIQDVQISNGTRTMIVEFFPLVAQDLEIPLSFGEVHFENGSILEGIVSDDMCKINPCKQNGTCYNTWNDFSCICPLGYKGKICDEMEFCQLQDCPTGSVCKNLNDGYECVANSTFDGKTTMLKYNYVNVNDTLITCNTIEITYRSKTGGTIFYVLNKEEYFIVSVYKDNVFIQWQLNGISEEHHFAKPKSDGNWTSILLIINDNTIKGGFKDMMKDDTPGFDSKNFNKASFETLISTNQIIIGGGYNTLDSNRIIEHQENNFNKTSYVVDLVTTESVLMGNSVDGPLNAVTTESPDLFVKLGDNFKGCLGEIRIGNILLPYFTLEELYANNVTFAEYFSLAIKSPNENVGCILCFDYDCQNNGKCKSSRIDYTCECTPGFESDDCSININECVDNKCRNNSTCVDGIANYTCDCEIGWEGWLCEIDTDDCESRPCLNSGTCIDLLGGYQCVCLEDYTGSQCEILPLITCENNPCKNGSRCIDGLNVKTGKNFTCDCAPGFVDEFCDIPFCMKDPCKNGTCTIVDGQPPICLCNRGFTGMYCEEDINDCILPGGGSPCHHGGKCIDGIEKYTCECSGTGYTGVHCEYDIDECRELRPYEICGGMGDCINLKGSYHCKCTHQSLCGRNCSLRNPCFPSDVVQDDRNYEEVGPCGQHGACVETCDFEPTYHCDCFDGYEGENCTQAEILSHRSSDAADIAIIVVPILLILLLIAGAGLAILITMARSKRATRGTYSPSAQEFCNPRVEMDHVLKPPPEERLI